MTDPAPNFELAGATLATLGLVVLGPNAFGLKTFSADTRLALTFANANHFGMEFQVGRGSAIEGHGRSHPEETE